MDWKSILFQFSMRIAGDRWDAEDLTQEAWLKVMESVRSKPERPVTKAFLYRIVKNTWIDIQRKRKIHAIPLDLGHETGAVDPLLTTRELLEQLAERVPAKMAVILLLMEVLDFTAKETAVFVQMKEAAVQVTLGRARKKLKQAAQYSSWNKVDVRNASGEKPADLDGLVEAFRRRDPEAIYQSYIGLAQQGIQLARLQAERGRLRFTFRDSDGNLFQVISD